MSSPANIVDLGNGYAIHWPDQNIRILLEYLAKERNGIIGEITILDGASTLCESLRINLNAEPKTKSIAKKVHENDGRFTLPDWARMIESTCVLTLRRYRRGEPSQYLDRHTIVEPLTFAINPLVPKKKSAILFSDGGKGKSTFALALALAVNAGGTVAGVSALKGKALYLDWEDDVDVHARRLQAIQAGQRREQDTVVERVGDEHILRRGWVAVDRRPAGAVGIATSRSEDGEVGQVANADPGPSVQDLPPTCWDGRPTVHRAGERACDRGDRVGVMAAAHGSFERVDQAGPVMDRRPRALQRLDRPSILREVPGSRRLGLVDQPCPALAPLLGEVGELAGEVELAGAYGVSDRQRPQHAGVAGIGLPVGQRGHGSCGVGKRLLLPVVEVRQGDRPGPHQ